MKDKDSDNMNYDFTNQNDPSVRMGEGNFANLPPNAMITPLGRAQSYRAGDVESLVDTLKKKTKIHENQR